MYSRRAPPRWWWWRPRYRNDPAINRTLRRIAKGTRRARYATRCAFWASAGALAVACWRNEGIRRTVQFNYHCMPMGLHYKWVEYWGRGLPDEVRAARFAVLHTRYKGDPLQICLKMGGFYVKIGQVMSTAKGVLPDVFVDSLKVLQDDAPSQPFSFVEECIEAELGVPLDDVFRFVDPSPLGAASIGQVHRAALRDGTDVVIKVQYPNSERNFYIDMNNFLGACHLLAPDKVGILEEIKKNFLNEFDYGRESALMATAAHNLRDVFPTVAVPLPIDGNHPKCPQGLPQGLCTKRVLVMETLHGRSLERRSREMLAAMAEKTGQTTAQVAAEWRAKFERGEVPSRRQLRAYALVTRARDGIHNCVAFLYNWTLGWVGTLMKYVTTPIPMHAPSVVDLMWDVFGHQIFVDGFFNGDPHPGNIMLLDDGRMGLIDFGQMVSLGAEERCCLARLVVALDERDDVLAAELFWAMGFRTRGMRPYTAARKAAFFYSRHSDDVVGELGGVAMFEENLHAPDPLIREAVPFMAARCVILGRLNAAMMGIPGIDSARVLRPWAEACLRTHGEPLPPTVPGRQLPDVWDRPRPAADA